MWLPICVFDGNGFTMVHLIVRVRYVRLGIPATSMWRSGRHSAAVTGLSPDQQEHNKRRTVSNKFSDAAAASVGGETASGLVRTR
jgi:hypothetical protein